MLTSVAHNVCLFVLENGSKSLKIPKRSEFEFMLDNPNMKKFNSLEVCICIYMQ
jgi:hypothetical protein